MLLKDYYHGGKQFHQNNIHGKIEVLKNAFLTFNSSRSCCENNLVEIALNLTLMVESWLNTRLGTLVHCDFYT